MGKTSGRLNWQSVPNFLDNHLDRKMHNGEVPSDVPVVVASAECKAKGYIEIKSSKRIIRRKIK